MNISPKICNNIKKVRHNNWYLRTYKYKINNKKNNNKEKSNIKILMTT